MEKLYKIGFFASLIAIVILLLIMPFGCSDEKLEVSSVDTVWMPSKDKKHFIPLPHSISVPVPYKVEVPIAGDTIWMPPLETKMDTLAILFDYATKRHYNDSIVNDSVVIYLKEHVFKNNLFRDSIGYRWKAKSAIITKTVEERQRQLLFLGVEPNVNLKQLDFGMYLSADFDTERALIGIGYDPYHKSYKFAVKAKLSLWKKRKK
jgi:hypothetical protein